jgi:hypothetical protein
MPLRRIHTSPQSPHLSPRFCKQRSDRFPILFRHNLLVMAGVLILASSARVFAPPYTMATILALLGRRPMHFSTDVYRSKGGMGVLPHKHPWVIVVLSRSSQLDLEKTETINLKQSMEILPNRNRINGNGAGGGTRTRTDFSAGF